MDQVRAMKVFVRVFERSSFTLAAEDLQMPRATLTHAINRLEARLGTRLLVFDKVRLDPQAPNAYGARITYDIPLNETRLSAMSGKVSDNVYALRG